MRFVGKFLVLAALLFASSAFGQQVGAGCTPIGRGAGVTGYFSDCATASGTANAVVLTPTFGSTASIAQMSKFAQYRFQATATSTGNVTLRLGAAGPGPYNVYTNAGQRIASGGILIGNWYTVGYDPALNSAAGGWRIISGGAVQQGTVYARAVCDGATDDAAAIQAAIDSVTALAGKSGTVQLPAGSCAIASGLTIRSGVKLIGSGHGFSHDVGSSTYGTRLVWTGGVSGTAKLIDMSPTEGASAQNIQGGGVVGIGLLCQNIAGYGLYSKSVFNGDFAIYSEGCITAGAFLGAADTLGEATSWQNNTFSMLSRQYDVSNGPCLILDGSLGGSGGNVSFNNFTTVKCLHLNQVGVSVKNADNNIFWDLITNSTGAPSAGVILRAGATAPETARNNLIMSLSSNIAAVAEGTNVATVASGPNKIVFYDKANGTPNPSCGTGATLDWQSNAAALNGIVVGTNCGGTSAGPLTGDVTTTGTSLATTIANNAVTLAKLATQATNTVLGNATSGTAVPTALAVGSCSGATNALNWTTNTGFGCNGAVGSVTSITPGAGTTSTLTATAPGSAVTTAGTLSSAHLINAQTGTTYAILDADRAKLITAVNASAQAYSIAQAGAASAFQSGWYVDIANNSTTLAGVVTVTPTTSTINGASTYTILPGQAIRIVSDGSNYQVVNFGGSGDVVYTYTPTLVCGAGTLTSAVATAHFQRMNKKSVLLTVSIAVTTIGSCANNIGFNLPIATNGTLGSNLFGRNGSTGVNAGCTAAAASTAMTCNNFDGSTIGVTSGQTLAVQGEYESQ